MRSPDQLKQMVNDLLVHHQLVKHIVGDIYQHNGSSFLVGGAVRDLILNLPVTDLDIEVHGISLEVLEKILRVHGMVNYVGKAFGVLRIERLAVDWSIPRADKAGRKPLVKIDPYMNIKKAFERRDLTMNAMGINLITLELVDPFDGYSDMKEGVLRTPNPAFFVEDPLRFYRVMAFIARFNMWPDRQLNRLCATMDIAHVSHERIETEYKKWLLKSEKPSQTLVWLDMIGRLPELLPEIAATKSILQEPDWHPEGNVFEHTKQTIDAAALLHYESYEKKLVIMYAALCHDLGKIVTTKLRDGRLTCYDHPRKGIFFTKKLLKRVTHNKKLIASVCKLVETHLYPAEFIKGHARLNAYKRLALKLAPEVTMAMLALVSLADKRGRNKSRKGPLNTTEPDIEAFLKNAQAAGVLTTVEKPLLTGKDLMPEIEPGPLMGALVKQAYALQLQEGIDDKEALKKLLLKNYSK